MKVNDPRTIALRKINRLLIPVILLVFIFGLILGQTQVFGLSKEQKRIFNKSIYYYNVSCSSLTNNDVEPVEASTPIRVNFQNIGRKDTSPKDLFNMIKTASNGKTNVIYNFAEINEGNDNEEREPLKQVFGSQGWTALDRKVPTKSDLADYKISGSSEIDLYDGLQKEGVLDRYLIITEYEHSQNSNLKVAMLNTHFIFNAYNGDKEVRLKPYWDQSWSVLKNKVEDFHKRNYNVMISGDFNRTDLPKPHPQAEQIIVGPENLDYIFAVPSNGYGLSSSPGTVNTPSGESFHKNIWADVTFEAKDSSGSNSKNVYILGDSIVEGAYFGGGKHLKDELDKLSSNIEVNASTGRTIDGGGTTRDKTSGLEAAEADKEKIKDADIVIVALGTNDGPSGLKTNIGKLAGKIKDYTKDSDKNTKTFWVNVFSEGGKSGYDKVKKEEINEIIESQKSKGNYEVIDTTSADIRLADSVHPTAAGYKTYSIVVSEAIAAAGSTPLDKPDDGNCSCGEGIGPSAGTLPDNIPAYWRNLINNAKKKYKDVDERVVAAVLWVENRGWPDPKTNWGVSYAGAKGPFQFIDSTWASMGQDGDGDGIKDQRNPKDAVLAAFEHHRGSAGKPVMKGYKNNPEEAFKSLPFEREDTNLLYYIAKYNGDDSSSVEGSPMASFPRGQNGDYVQMGFWLLATNFTKGWDPAAQKTVSATDSSKPAYGDGGGSLSVDCSEGEDGASSQVVDGVAWPVDIKFWKEDRQLFLKPHHSYPAVDIGVPTGTKVYSVLEGTVVSVSSSGNCGNGVFIKSPGNILTGYCHAESVKVKTGEKVEAGDLIMVSDNTGRSSGPHLHIQIDVNGQAKCPQQIFKDLSSNKKPSFENLASSGCVG